MQQQKATLKIDANTKAFRSPIYNYIFDKKTGFFVRWGKTLEDDPPFSPYGPELEKIKRIYLKYVKFLNTEIQVQDLGE